MKEQKKPWSGRFRQESHRLVDEFNASISFDKRLYRHDIRGSIAHAMTLRKAGVLTEREAGRIISGLRAIEKEISAQRFAFSPGLEDIHMAVEKRLIEKIGPVGGKLHTGRSRNDQVATDVRLFLKDEISAVAGLLHELKKTLVEAADKNLGCVMPGYTHLQRAQPVLLSHHLLAYYEMFKRDTGRLLDCLSRLDELPLGSGALAGSPYKLDRRYTAKLLGFGRVTENSMDAVSDRDSVIEFICAAAVIMTHVSRLSEEMVLWSSQEFGFVEISDSFSTGSSIMPQKKNPDVAELSRGKAGRVYGSLVSMLTTMKGLPLSYNKDMQEDKEPLFDAVDTVKGVLGILAPMLRATSFRKEAMEKACRTGFLNATDAADYLVKKGVPFREAHRVVGRIVAYCSDKGLSLEDLSERQWKGFSGKFSSGIQRAVSIKTSVNARKIYGGTALDTVKRRISKVKAELGKGPCYGAC